MKNELGNRYGRLIVRTLTQKRKFGQIVWKCVCDCGKNKEVLSSALRQGTTRSCGCLRNHDKRLKYGESSKRLLLRSYKYSAKKRGHSWGLSKRNFYQLVSADCHYCGAKPRQVYQPNKKSFGSFSYNGIDRVENLRGYCEGNVVTCCTICNVAKGIQSPLEFLTWVRRVYEKNLAGF